MKNDTNTSIEELIQKIKSTKEKSDFYLNLENKSNFYFNLINEFIIKKKKEKKKIFTTSININDITEDNTYIILDSGRLKNIDENDSDENDEIYKINYSKISNTDKLLRKKKTKKQFGGQIIFEDSIPHNEMEEITGLYHCNTIRFNDCDVLYPFNLNFKKIIEYFSSRTIQNQKSISVLFYFFKFKKAFSLDIDIYSPDINTDEFLDKLFNLINEAVNYFKKKEEEEINNSNINSIPRCKSENELFEYSNLIIRFLSNKMNFCKFLLLIIKSKKHIKDIANRYYLHNNGFDKIVLAKIGKCKLRLHIWWSNSNNNFAEQPHDHRWSFASCNVSGSFRTQIFEEVYEPFGKIPGIDNKKIYDMGKKFNFNKDADEKIIHNPKSFNWELGDFKPFYKYVYTSPTDVGQGNGVYRNIASGLYKDNSNYRNVCFLQLIEDVIFPEGSSYVYPKRKIHSIVKDDLQNHCVTLVLTLPPTTKHNRLYTKEKFKLYKNISMGSGVEVEIIKNLQYRMLELLKYLLGEKDSLDLPERLNIDLPGDQ